MKPLHLLLPLWGVDYCDSFLSLGGKCLMWQLPEIARKREVVVVTYTSRVDWQYLKRHELFSRWGRPIFFRPVAENAKRDLWTSRHSQMTLGHRVMLEAARAARAIAVPIFADSVFANGDLRTLLDLCTGYPRRMLLCIGFRASHEGLTHDFNPSKPLSRRDLVALALRHLHSQMRCWDARAPAYGDDILGGPQWHVSDSALVTHSIYWEPCAIDFSYSWPCDTQPVLDWTIDGHFPWANLEGPHQYHCITDSDEYFHLTTAHETGPNAYHSTPAPMQGTLIEELRRARGLTTTDPLRQRLFELPFVVHSTNIQTGDLAPTLREAAAAVTLSRVPLNEPYAFAESSPWDQDPQTQLPPPAAADMTPEERIDAALRTLLEASLVPPAQ